MSYKIATIPQFDKDFKRLAKKYPSLKLDIQQLAKELSKNPTHGIALGNNCFKIRLAISSKGKGKSGGARIITYVFIEGVTVFLLTIFDKSDQENISDKELKQLLKLIS